MRIDLTQAAVAQVNLENIAAQAGRVQRRVEPKNVEPTRPVNDQHVEAATKVTATLPEPNQLNVSVDDKQNVIYRFTDPNNGEVVRQVPPEQILRIMRNIEDLLHESEQKLKVTL